MNRVFLRSITLLLLAASGGLPLVAQRNALPVKSGARPLAAARLDLNAPWSLVGPRQTSSPGLGLIAGRVLSIAVDPADASGNTVYLGTTGGGVWKSTNAASAAANVSFSPATDGVPSIDPNAGWLISSTIGALSVQPEGTGVILAGSGDPSGALDSFYGDGILRSADGGKTWKIIAQSSDRGAGHAFSFFGLSFAGFAWSTSSPNLVVAAVASSLQGGIVNAGDNGYSAMGLYYSQDAGQTWYLSTITDGVNETLQSRSTNFSGFSGNAVTSVVWNPLRQAFFAAVRYHGYYQSTDGATWTRLPQQPGSGLTAKACPANPGGVGASGCPIYRGALAVQPVSGDMFALSTDSTNKDQGIWQDVCAVANGVCGNGAVSFAGQIASTDLEDGSQRIAQASYDLWLQAVPAGADTLLFAGTKDIFRCSLAAGCAWRNATNTNTCAAAKVGPAQHAVDWVHGTGTLFFGNDAGLWRTTDGIAQSATPCTPDDAAHFDNLNGGLESVADISYLAQDPANVSTLLAATGTTGILASNGAGGGWQQVLPQSSQYYGIQSVAIDWVSGQNWFTSSGDAVSVNECGLGSGCDAAGFGGRRRSAARKSREIATGSTIPRRGFSIRRTQPR
ncbi:MAG: WD40/YVTN/BNR-like repeat-containing protein [Acidobacteriaceae bacterium]